MAEINPFNKISCDNCQAACCKGPITMDLATDEFEFMRDGGGLFHTIEEPANYDREQVRYPVSFTINKLRNTIQFFAETGNEYKPLPAGVGRYMLVGSCGYLIADSRGREYCSVYESKDRPVICGSFEEAGPKCVRVRLLRKIPDPYK